MSIRSEIRAALVDGPKTTDELLPLVASVEGDRKRLQQHMGNLSGEQMVRRTGLSDEGAPIYQLDPKKWPAKGEEGEATAIVKASDSTGRSVTTVTTVKRVKTAKPAKVAKKAKAPKKPAPKKSQRTAAKLQRKTAKRATPRLAPATANAIQVGGSHYQALSPQPWDVIHNWGLSFLAGNVIKYVARAPAKGGIEDLHKARHYLDKLIETAA